MSFNRAVEAAQNEMLLLNVVRSSLRRPMYITGIQTASGSIETGVSAGLAFPFGEFRTKKGDPASGTTGAVYTENPSFDVAVFNTKEFVTGFTTPIEPKLMAYYWDQGWKPSLLLHLLVEYIRITWPDGTTEIFDNYPDAEDDSLCHHVRFAVLAEHLTANNISLQRIDEKTVVGPAFPARALDGQLEAFVSAHKEKLEISPVEKTDTYQFRTASQKVNVVLERRGEVLARAKTVLDTVCAGKPAPSPGRSPSMATAGDDKSAVEIFLRSPEAILYYLGELVRVETREENPRIPTACISGRFEPVFLAQTRGCPRRSIEADYNGDHYFIPERIAPAGEKECGEAAKITAPEGVKATDLTRYLAPLSCNGGRSMSALTLVEQLINLQKSASDLPAPRLVRTVGN